MVHSTCANAKPLPIKVLILPKFEKGGFDCPSIGEGQLFYNHYFKDSQQYILPDYAGGGILYVKDYLALCITGICKVQSSMTLTTLLLDPRFDFTDCYILSVGCAGGNPHTTILGDVVLSSSTVDYDLGHHADIRDMKPGADYPVTWFRENAYDEIGFLPMNESLVSKSIALLSALQLKNTPETEDFMLRTFTMTSASLRDPKVICGTTVSSDNYWKGLYDNANAEYIVRSYGCPDPFCASEMEDHALAMVCHRFGMLDHYLSLRGIVNATCFGKGDFPEKLWDRSRRNIMDFGVEAQAQLVFDQTMEHVLQAGKLIISAVLDGHF